MNIQPAGVLAAVAATAGAWAVLVGTGAASAGDADPHPLLTVSPSPPVGPRPAPLWLTNGGVKMHPLPGPGLAANAEPAHTPGEWYAATTSVNPFAATNFVRRDGTGTYLVWFPGLTPPGPVEAVATAPTGTRCTAVRVVLAPAAYPGTDVTISCVTGTTRATDATFTVRF